MNLSLLDPFQSDFPEVIEEYLDDGDCKCLAFNRRGTLLAGGCSDGSCILWDFDTRGVAKILQDPESCLAPVSSVAWSKCSRKLLAALSIQNRIALWDVPSGRVEAVVDFSKRVVAARLNPREPSICVVCQAGSPPILVDLRFPGVQVPVPLAGEPHASSSSSGKAAEGFAGSKGRKGNGPAPSGAVQGAGSSVLSTPAVFHRDGEVLIVGTSSGTVLLVRCCWVERQARGRSSKAHGRVLLCPSILASLPVPGGACIKQLSLSRDCSLILVNSTDRVLRVLNLALHATARDKAEGSEFMLELVGRGSSSARPEDAQDTPGEACAWEVGKPPTATVQSRQGQGSLEPAKGGERETTGEGGAQMPAGEAAQGVQQSTGAGPVGSQQECPEGVLSDDRGTEVGRAGSRQELVAENRTFRVQLGQAKEEFSDAVNRVQWRNAVFSGDGEFIMAGAASRGEHRLHIWSRYCGQLLRILEGPQLADGPGVVEVLWHPIQKLAVSVSFSGVVYIWAQDYREMWSAFAPDFRELEENEEYVEREDEFDVNPREDSSLGGQKGGGNTVKGEPEEEEVDIEAVERVAAYSDTDDSEDGLLYLPVSLEPDTRASTANGEPAKGGEEQEGKGLSAHALQGRDARSHGAEDKADKGSGAPQPPCADTGAVEGAVDAEREKLEEGENDGSGKKQRKRKLSEKGASLVEDKTGSRRRSLDKAERPLLCKAQVPAKEGAGKCAPDNSPAASAGLVVSHTGSEAIVDAIEVEQVL